MDRSFLFPTRNESHPLDVGALTTLYSKVRGTVARARAYGIIVGHGYRSIDGYPHFRAARSSLLDIEQSSDRSAHHDMALKLDRGQTC